MMLRSIMTILEMENFQPLGAPNGRIGLDVALKEIPDLILCDVMMPEMDGHAVLRQLRAAPTLASVPFIFLTAKGERADLRTGMNLGADDYLIKPVHREELLEAMAARLEQHQARKQEFEEALAASRREFKPDFSSAIPLEKLGLTPREAEVLLWVAQGKSNGDIATILIMSEGTVKKHLANIFAKLGLENRSAALLMAVEALSKQ